MTEIELGPRSLRAYLSMEFYKLYIESEADGVGHADAIKEAGAFLAELERTAKPEYLNQTVEMLHDCTKCIIQMQTVPDLRAKLEQAEARVRDLEGIREERDEAIIKLGQIDTGELDRLRAFKASIDAAAAKLPVCPHEPFSQRESTLIEWGNIMRSTAAALQVRNAELEDIASDRLAQLRDQAILTKATQDKCDALQVRVGEMENLSPKMLDEVEDYIQADHPLLVEGMNGRVGLFVEQWLLRRLICDRNDARIARDAALAEAEGLRRELEEAKATQDVYKSNWSKAMAAARRQGAEEALTELRMALAGIESMWNLNGSELIKRLSVLDLVDRRREALATQHLSDCPSNNAGVPELLGRCDCFYVVKTEERERIIHLLTAPESKGGLPVTVNHLIAGVDVSYNADELRLALAPTENKEGM